MSSLEKIQIYFSDSDESSEGEDCGFDSEKKNGELFPCNDVEKIQRFRSYFASLSREKDQDPENDDVGEGSSSNSEQQILKHSGDDTTGGSSCFSETAADTDMSVNPDPAAPEGGPGFVNADGDSDDSFFGTEPESMDKSKSKRTKKESRKRDIAERRRQTHPVISQNCGCSKECGNLVSKDDRNDINKVFWSLDAAGQKHFIRERVQRKAVERRSRNFFTDENLRKRHSYVFHIRTVSSDEAPTVCRKFFLNTLGYGEHCG